MKVLLNHHELMRLSDDPKITWCSEERLAWAGLEYVGLSARYCHETRTQWFTFVVVDQKRWLRAVISTGVKYEQL